MSFLPTPHMLAYFRDGRAPKENLVLLIRPYYIYFFLCETDHDIFNAEGYYCYY